MNDENKDQQENQYDFEFKHEEESPSQSLKNKLTVARQILKNIQSNIEQLFSLLNEGGVITESSLITETRLVNDLEAGGRVIEGVFDGQNMIGPDGKQYTVPSNYASKSKLVEGDILKLTITRSGSFIYKQIGPIERSRIIGTVAFDEDAHEYYVTSNNRKYRVLPASITYFKGEPGDEAVILVPKDSDSGWAAVENVIRKI